MAKTLYSQYRGPGSIPCPGTKSHMQQLKISSAETKSWHSQINKEAEGCKLPGNSLGLKVGQLGTQQLRLKGQGISAVQLGLGADLSTEASH